MVFNPPKTSYYDPDPTIDKELKFQTLIRNLYACKKDVCASLPS